jgi:isopentenyl phosphate kinase
MSELVFLKLGGSLITDKTQPYIARPDKLRELTREIAAALAATPDLRLVLGHGSGSFGHTAAKQYGTREGLSASSADTVDYWRGFSEVRLRAAELNALVMRSLHEAGIAALSIAPSAAVIARDGQVTAWEITIIRRALESGLLPVIYGDAVFDELRGGTILSTEELFQSLARRLTPSRILLAGLEAGVWEDFPGRTRLLSEIKPGTRAAAGSAVGADVTGGMESKVRQMLTLADELGLTARIFSGEVPGNLQRALTGEAIGTLITD